MRLLNKRAIALLQLCYVNHWGGRPLLRSNLRLEPLEDRQYLTAIGLVEHTVDERPTRYAGLLDVDDDGDLDILVDRDPNLAWLENQGGREFTVRDDLIKRSSAGRIYTGDIDGDGDEDVIANYSVSARVVWFENLDDSTYFGSPRLIDETSRFDCEIADLDGDGDLDLLDLDYFLGPRWYENIDGGSQFRKWSLGERILGARFVVAELDSQPGAEVLVIRRWEANAQIYNVVEDQLLLRTTISTTGEATSIQTSDINDDGIADVILGDGSSILFLQNDGTGEKFSLANQIETNLQFPLSDLWYEDFTNDGVKDVVGTYFIVGEWTPDGTPLTPKSVLLTAVDNGQWSETTLSDKPIQTVVDIVGDSRLNLVMQGGDAEIGDAANEFFSVATGGRYFAPSKSDAFDIDMDGDLDMISVALASGCRPSRACAARITVHENNGGSNFHKKTSIDIEGPFLHEQFMILGVDIDLLAIEHDFVELRWTIRAQFPDTYPLTVDGLVRLFDDGSYKSVLLQGFGYSLYDLIDIDFDGRLDLVGGKDGLMWSRRDAEGDFGNAEPLPFESVSGRIRSINSTDVDGDGDLDLLVTAGQQQIRTFLFQRAEDDYVLRELPIQLGDRILFADIDGDSVDELLSANPFPTYDLDIYEWHDNTFRMRQSLPEVAFVVPSDRDLDGDIDIDAYRNVWTSDGGRFVLAEPIHNIAPTNSATGDFDGDGDIDAFYDGIFYERRVVGDSNNDGVFNSADLVMVFRSVEYEDRFVNNSTFVEGDWNGDGDFDSSDLTFAFQAGTYVASARELDLSYVAAEVGARIHSIREPRTYVA
ncbi:MAG: VCBS repeat-containing protein [Planctomycetales bacterium]|nr:VCBS repeat-containing protein [Planctomycetales bacterium]